MEKLGLQNSFSSFPGELTLPHLRLTKSHRNLDSGLARIHEWEGTETLETDRYVYHQWINNEGAKKV